MYTFFYSITSSHTHMHYRFRSLFASIMQACTSRVDDMGPGTYFQRVILEGLRGDNMRNITSHKKINLNSYSNNDGDNSDDEEEGVESGDMKGEKEVVNGVQKELEHEEDRRVEGKKVLSLVEPGNIRRVIFCSGKVCTYCLARTTSSIVHLFH